METENDVLEETLSIAEGGYALAYDYLQKKYENDPEAYGPQTLYFLACLAGGTDLPEKALEWLTVAIFEKGWWYRPEVLEDDDLSLLRSNDKFISLKSISDHRHAEAMSGAKAVFTWENKKADKLFIAVHGNTQNGQTARSDWEPILHDNTGWQLETVQSAVPDGYGTFRWNYDMLSYLPVAHALGKVQCEGYERIVCGGFSAGCDILLRTIIYSEALCNTLILQSPWISILKDHEGELGKAFKQKNIELKIFCGSCDEDCLSMAEHLYEITVSEGIQAELTVQEGSRHQFSKKSAWIIG
jgi:hypothetical protein